MPAAEQMARVVKPAGPCASSRAAAARKIAVSVSDATGGFGRGVRGSSGSGQSASLIAGRGLVPKTLRRLDRFYVPHVDPAACAAGSKPRNPASQLHRPDRNVTFAEPAQSPGPMLYRRYTLHISKIHIDPKGMATPPHQELTDHCRAPAQLASFTKLTSRCPVFGSSRKTESPCCCRILPIAAVSGTSMAGSRA